MTEAQRNEAQIEALLVVQYISAFNTLEQLIRQVFEQEITKTDHKLKNKLYFLYGSTIGADIYYKYEDSSLDLSSKRKYDDNELFKKLSINKLIKFDQKEKLIKSFDYTINSVQMQKIEFTFYNMIVKILNMRNKLAHEPMNFKFKSADCIEQFSMANIKVTEDFRWLENLDLKNINDRSISIYSNLTYLFIIKSQLENLIKQEPS